MSKIIKFIDLFAGMGGLRLGFESACKELGLEPKCVFTSEIKAHAIKAYSSNFKDSKISGDITKVDTSSLPDFDYLLGGFPCQPFSTAGKQLGFADTRGTLFFEIERILKDKRPKGFILENVEGLLTNDNGNTIKVILEKLKALNYNVSYKVINSVDFGVPQNRKRLYIVGKQGVSVDLETDYPEVKSVKFGDIIEHQENIAHNKVIDTLLSKYKIDELNGKKFGDKRGGGNNIHSWDVALRGEVTKQESEVLDGILTHRRNKKYAKIYGIDFMDGMPLTYEMIREFISSSISDKELHKMLDRLSDLEYLRKVHPKKLVNGKRVEDTKLPLGYNIATGKLSFPISNIIGESDILPTLVATDMQKIHIIDNGYLRPISIREGLRAFGYPESYSLNMLPTGKAYDLLGNTVVVTVIKYLARQLIK